MSAYLHKITSIVLDQVANGSPTLEILNEICTGLERELPGSIVGVTILDRTAQVFEQAVFPSLARDYAEALKGILVADKPGSCALAVFNGQPVECRDVETDPRFSDAWKTLSLAHGLKALVSLPCMSADGLALGTLVVAFPPDAPLSEADRALADQLAFVCASVLSYRRTQLKNDLLIGELQHRVRNLFSTIGAVVYATLRSHPDPETFRTTFDGRLAALAKVHSFALEPAEADLRGLLVDTLAPFSIDRAVHIEGPRLMLSQEAAVAFSLAAHELATNAAKYGAFSNDGGSVRIRWELEEAEGQTRFGLTWHEEGGPTVRPPSRQGYGQKTLSRSVASAFDGAVELDYRPEGLLCSVTAPFSPRLGARPN